MIKTNETFFNGNSYRKAACYCLQSRYRSVDILCQDLWWWAISKNSRVFNFVIFSICKNRENFMLAKYTWFTVSLVCSCTEAIADKWSVLVVATVVNVTWKFRVLIFAAETGNNNSRYKSRNKTGASKNKIRHSTLVILYNVTWNC